MPLNFAYYKVEIELDEDLLGTVPKNKEVYREFIAAKARDHAEKETRRAAQDERRGDEDTATPRMASGAEATPEEVAKLMEEEVETVEDIEERGWTGQPGGPLAA